MNDYKITMAAARTNAGISQQKIADEMHVSRMTIHNWETGKVIPKPAELILYCNICKAPIEIIFLPGA